MLIISTSRRGICLAYNLLVFLCRRKVSICHQVLIYNPFPKPYFSVAFWVICYLSIAFLCKNSIAIKVGSFFWKYYRSNSEIFLVEHLLQSLDRWFLYRCFAIVWAMVSLQMNGVLSDSSALISWKLAICIVQGDIVWLAKWDLIKTQSLFFVFISHFICFIACLILGLLIYA